MSCIKVVTSIAFAWVALNLFLPPLLNLRQYETHLVAVGAGGTAEIRETRSWVTRSYVDSIRNQCLATMGLNSDEVRCSTNLVADSWGNQLGSMNCTSKTDGADTCTFTATRSPFALEVLAGCSVDFLQDLAGAPLMFAAAVAAMGSVVLAGQRIYILQPLSGRPAPRRPATTE